MNARETYGAHLRALLVLGLPLIGSNLAQMALHVTDTVMLGWYGVEALAAVVLGASTYFILYIIGAGYSIAMMGLVASALGAGDETQVRRATRMTMWHSILFGLAILPLLWWSGPVLRALGQEPELSQLAQDYLRIAGFGMVPALIVNTLRSYLSALERTGVVLVATLVGAVVNVILNWMLIFGHWGAPEMGVRGAAVATLTTQFVTALFLAVYGSRHPALRKFRLFQRFWRPDWEAFATIWRLGWPVGLTGLAEGGLFNASALMMGWVGTVPLAAHGIALEIAALTFMVHLGLSNAATVRVGRAHGQADTLGLRDSAVVAMGLSFVLAAMAVVVFLTWPEFLISLFLNPDDPLASEIVAFGALLLAAAAAFQFADAAQVMALGFLRGVQDTRAPMILAAISYWLIGIPTSYVLAFTLGLGGVGLWIGLVVGLVFAAAFLLGRFWRGWLGASAAV
ncbi:MAG: MATE family efflux transporter [Paracoccaceae bacterium]